MNYARFGATLNSLDILQEWFTTQNFICHESTQNKQKQFCHYFCIVSRFAWNVKRIHYYLPKNCLRFLKRYNTSANRRTMNSMFLATMTNLDERQ